MLQAVASVARHTTPELSIVMPCLNEVRTVGICVEKAFSYLETRNIQGEVIVADNGSTDGSQAIALDLGARVVPVAARGYGSALSAGIEAARGRLSSSVILITAMISATSILLFPSSEPVINW
jgi:glycosyltransferase involved in cell wall biosynthesis